MGKIDSELGKNARFIGLARRAVRPALLALVKSGVIVTISALWRAYQTGFSRA
jgi:hypothetical protein